jgi:hypothetical protein
MALSRRTINRLRTGRSGHMGLIDQGGARMRERDWQFDETPFGERLKEEAARQKREAKAVTDAANQAALKLSGGQACITVEVVETHNGEPCDCIADDAKRMVLCVGDTLDLTHVCHDGRKDVVSAKVVAINFPAPTEPHHASAEVRPA